MLAEKFFLALEAKLRAQEQQSSTERSRRVVSTSPHVPVKLAPGSRLGD